MTVRVRAGETAGLLAAVDTVPDSGMSHSLQQT